MREKHTVQSSIFELYADHDFGRELQAMSEWLDGHPVLLNPVMADIGNRGAGQEGRKGLPAESVLRCAILKQYRQLSYEALTFHLMDSSSFQVFTRLPMGWFPKKTTLQQTISALSATTWEQINRALLDFGEQCLDPLANVVAAGPEYRRDLVVGALGLGRIRQRPMPFRDLGRQRRTQFVGVSTDRHHQIGRLDHRRRQPGRFLIADIDAGVAHRGDRAGVLPVRFDAGGLHHDARTGQASTPAFGHLRTAGVAGAQE